jgi:NADH:ubiquinone oxidoreductase subunit K
LGASWNLLFCVKFLHLFDAYIFILLILAVAAIEIVVGSGLLILTAVHFKTINLLYINNLGKFSDIKYKENEYEGYRIV